MTVCTRGKSLNLSLTSNFNLQLSVMEFIINMYLNITHQFQFLIFFMNTKYLIYENSIDK
jgi:hypothetical protein